MASILTDYYDLHASRLPSRVQADIAVRFLLRHYGSMRVSAVTLEAQDRYIARRQAAGVGNETISREQSVLRAALNRAYKYGQLASAPYVKSLPKAPPRERFLTRTEAAKLLRACKSVHLRNFIRLGLYTGARRGAILDLTWDRVDLTRRLIHYPLPSRTQNNKRRAVVPIEGALLTALQRAKRFGGNHVISYRGEAVASIKTAFAAACWAAGLKGVSPHVLRHTAATWAAQAGEALWDVAGMLGQREKRTTELYAKHQPEYLRKTARAMLRGAPNDAPIARGKGRK